MEAIREGKEELSRKIAGFPVAGIHAMTTLDYPGKLAAVFFTKGCPWRCRYCHNPGLRDDGGDSYDMEYIEDFLKSRAGFLEAVVISGGEPTHHKNLPDFLQWVRGFGYETALHTNGCCPQVLRRVVVKKLVDYIAMDVKAPPASYDRVTGARNTCVPVSRSIDIILASGIDYEFRTTYHPDILTEEELIDIIDAVSSIGAKRFFLQRFRSVGVEDDELAEIGDTAVIPEAAVERARRRFEDFDVR